MAWGAKLEGEVGHEASVRSTCAEHLCGVCRREADGCSGGACLQAGGEGQQRGARCRAEEAVAWRTLVVGLVGWPEGWLASAALSRCAWMWKQRLRFSEVDGEIVEVELWMMC